MSDRREIEELSFETWWNEKGINSVILRAMALTAWMARAELKETPPVNQPARTTEEINAEYHAAQAALKSKNPKPEQWPKYCAPVEKRSSCTGKQVAYYRRDDERKGETVHTDGTSFAFSVWDNELVKTRCITEVEAMSLLKKPEPQPQKTRVRLWGTPSGKVWINDGYTVPPDWQEIHHDSEGFYIEE